MDFKKKLKRLEESLRSLGLSGSRFNEVLHVFLETGIIPDGVSDDVAEALTLWAAQIEAMYLSVPSAPDQPPGDWRKMFKSINNNLEEES